MSSLEKMLINTPNFGHKWQLLWPHNIRPWVWCSPISFCDLPSVLLDYMALSFRTYKLDGHSGNLSKWLGVLQSWKIRGKEKKPPVVAIGTQHLQTPLLLSLRDWHLSLLAMYCVLHVNLAHTSFGYHLHKTWCCHRKTKTHTLHYIVGGAIFLLQSLVRTNLGAIFANFNFGIAQNSNIGLHHTTSFNRVGWQSCNVPMGRRTISF